MAHGFSSVTKAPEPGLNIGGLIAGKIKDSFGMAAEERKARDEEITKLEAKSKEDRTDEESQRLEELLEQKKTRTTGGKKDRIKNSFFTKAMMSQFGGDRTRRMQGTFSKNPRESQDPSLTKEQRFSALLDESMGAPAEAPDTPDDYDDSMNSGAPEGAAPPQQSGLDKVLSKVSEALAIISTKVSALKSEEAKSKGTTESRLSKFNGVFESIKNYFDRDNDLKETENSIEQQKIDNLKDAQADAKADRKEDSMDDTVDGSDHSDVEKLDEKGGGVMGGIMKGIKGLFKNFMGKKKGGKRGGKQQFSSPIGPQPMNSKTPWAAKGAGENGGMFGQSGFTPRLPATKLSEGGVVSRKKLAAGGIYDNPTTTTLNPGDAVVPLNRNNPIADSLNESGKEASKDSGDPSITSPMAEVMQLPTKVAGGLVLTKMSEVFSGIAGFLKPVVSPIINAIAPAFGLPATIISGLFGGAAHASTSGINMDAFTGKTESKTGRRRSPSSSSPSTPNGGPEQQYTVTGASKITKSQFGDRGFRTRDGLGSGATPFGHTGRDVPMPYGTPLSLVPPGTVIEASTGYNAGFGNLVTIKLDDGRYVKSNHHSRNLVKEGDRVGMQPDGSVKPYAEVGSTGRSTGPHLHLDLGTGYNKGPAAITGLMDPDAFILGGGIVTGGDQITASADDGPTPAAAPTQQAANSTNPVFTVPTQPTTQVSSQPPTSKQNSPPSALQSFLLTKQKLDRELEEDLQKFSVYDPSLGAASFYGIRPY